MLLHRKKWRVQKMDQNKVNLDEISNIQELKAMKSDEFDKLVSAESASIAAKSNISALTERIKQLEATPAPTPETSAPADDSSRTE